MKTLWLNKKRYNQALYVTVTKETEKAIQFQVIDNPKLSFYLPKKAVKVDKTVDSQLTIAHWFTGNEFLYNVFNVYSSVYSK